MSVQKQMTKKQLREVVAQYATMFPGWTTFEDIALVRESGPLQQMIWFQAMSSGAYRPTHVVRAVPIMMSRMLTQMPFRPSTIDYKAHDRKWREMLLAMEQQFKPDIRKPLDIAEVLELCKAEAQEAANDLSMLAVLYAWLDRKEEALNCCMRIQSCSPPAIAPMPAWEEQMKAFGRSLSESIQLGRAREFLLATGRT